MIDVRRLRLLRELDKRGTIVATAEAMHLTPSAVSQQLAVLARETGVRLLDPAGRRVRLTPAAQVLLEHADILFAQMERAEADLAAFDEGRVGSVSVAAFTTAISGIVAPALLALRESRPRLRLSVTDVPEPDCFDQLLAGDLDLAIGITHAGARPLDSRLLQIPLLDDPLDVALPAGHPYASARAVPLEALRSDEFIASRPGTACREVAHAACAAAGFVPQVLHNADDFTAVRALIAAGCGISLMPRLARLSSTPEVVLRPIAGVSPIRPIFAAIRRGSQQAPHLSAALAALVAAARSPDPVPTASPVVHGGVRSGCAGTGRTGG
ncbi:Transcriptional regulator [Frankia sp. AiPs1]|uniref:LysR family transcriptional regulator n=1 Tax=Frankia sp. AiPa1 TaxID=573492 RepID=UPI00202B7A3A|nr:LysR family transcriptional regulator [Frankia sp. AiPa1]MCL9762013.1 LysR family transcriptional regulator [Frankia sp. AiPa1]